VRNRTALLAAAVLTLPPLLAGCGSDGSAHDCPATAARIDGQVDALRGSATGAHDDPRDAATALRRIQQHLDDIAGRTDGNPAATRAVGALALAVSDVKNELDNGETVDITPVTRAAAALTTACPKE